MNTFLFYLIIYVVSVFGDYGMDEESEIVLLPTLDFENYDRSPQMPLNFTAFGEKFELLFRRNNHLVTSDFQVLKHDENGNTRTVGEFLNELDSCHYLYSDFYTSAALSFCSPKAVQGLIFRENSTFEISPLDESNPRFSAPEFTPHLIKKKSQTFQNTSTNQIFSRQERDPFDPKLTIELAVFLDETAYHNLSPLLNKNELKIRDMLLAYVNAIQALYHQPSLGRKIDIALVRLELMEKQPRTLPHFDGERERLLDSFCSYSKYLNPEKDEDPRHWDVGLYISGLDFFSFKNGWRDSVTMGLAAVGGACSRSTGCVIAEFGVMNHFGKPYPSAGFTSVFIAAHEIGHNLGMQHDSSGNFCPQNGFIMSPSRGTQGETSWSECSRSVARQLSRKMPCLLDTPSHKKESTNHDKFQDLPGREWSLKRQCQVFLRDKDAKVVTTENPCHGIKCKSRKGETFFAGPALEGSSCALNKECRSGECLGSCSSGCLQGSRGVIFDILASLVLCRDDRLCPRQRRSANQFASTKCAMFAEKLRHLVGDGSQQPHQALLPWKSCAIFCKRKNDQDLYAPRIEAYELGLNPYFPDGTWCHRDEASGEDYFCRRNHCLPEFFSFGDGKNGFYLGDNGTVVED